MSFRNYYDSTYTRSSRDTGRSTPSTPAPTTVTAKYLTPASAVKSSSIPIRRDHSNTREETPISTIANRYSSYSKKDDKPTSKYESYTKKDESLTSKYDSYTKKEDKPTKYESYTKKEEKPTSKYESYTKKEEKPTSKYEKKDYTKLSLPSLNTNRSRDVSPVSTSSKYSLRSSRHTSPERKTKSSIKPRSPDPTSAGRDKDIPSKTEKSYTSLSSYKLYPRSSSYTRPSSRTEIKSEVTVNRYAIANRLSSSSTYLRSPSVEKTRTSVSPVIHLESPKPELEKSASPTVPVIAEDRQAEEEVENDVKQSDDSSKEEEEFDENETETLTVVTRHTSPTPPGSSVYVRARRADMAKIIEKTITRLKRKPKMLDKEMQSDRLDDPTRCSRFGSTARAAVNTYSLYTPTLSSYTGYAGRYSTQYSTMRENNTAGYVRSSRSRSTEPKDIPLNSSSQSEPKDKEHKTTVCNFTSSNKAEVNPEIMTVYEHNKDNDTSEIIINVNLKLKKASNSPLVVSSQAELVSPEITITNNQLPQLPPPAPKQEGTTKTKKIKVRKASADSSSDSSSSPKKKVIKKRSKSVSSTDSEKASEVKEKSPTLPSMSPPKSISKTVSNSNVPNGYASPKHSKSRESNSPESSSTLSTQSSISEDEVSKSKTNEISRTSADEVSIPTDRSGKQPSPSKNEGAEEAKSFLIRALAPVTNLFKRNQDSGDSRWLENSASESTGKDVSNLITESDRSSKNKSNNTDDIVASNDDHVVKLKAIRHIESGERAWWMDSDLEKKINSSTTPSEKQYPTPSEKQYSTSDKNIPKKIRHIESGERAWWLESNGSSDNKVETQSTQTTDTSDRPFKKCKFVDDDKPWWLDSNANIPAGVERLTPPRKSSSESEKSEKFDFFKVRHIESGEKKDWWQTSNENSSNKTDNQNSLSKSGSDQKSFQNSLSKSGSDQKSFPLRRIRHVESGERAWWLSSSKNIPEGIEKLPTPPPEESDSSDSEEVQVYVPSAQIPPFPLNLPDDEPLGDRRSPEGLETPREQENYGDRVSPYENNRQNRRRGSNHLYQKEKYISRYTDIDDILGTCSQIYSPFMDSLLARRNGQLDDESECEEIDSTQVKIHDSTAQRPVIKKLRSRSEIIDCRDEDQLDDVALQVFRDGEYGPYLDLDATLGEQEEELDGLQDNRKNALILRTQLSLRVHALNERLLRSQGRELRRALFSLKQVLQTDDDLVHEFVANKGLDCLMQLGNVADHNYLDYILRALGQILLYVDGMHGVMAHARCVQWLYTLVASHYRHVVKTALKLLLVFVEYTEENCLRLIQAIAAVDGAAARPPWYNVMKILQDVDTSDTELLIYATSLINKCLNNTPDRDIYYDHVDSLQEQGIDDVIQLYMAKQGTDLDLLRQLQIFEAVLLYEDGDETGTALKQLDENVINSIRRRSISTGSSERRRSKMQQMKEKEKSNSSPHKDAETKARASLPLMKDKENQELSTALKRRKERYARQAHQITQQEMLNNSIVSYNGFFTKGIPENNPTDTSPTTNGIGYRKLKGFNQDEERTLKTLNVPEIIVNGNQRYPSNKEIVLTKEHSIRDLTQRLTSPTSPSDEKPSRVVEMAGIVSKAKKELAKSQSKEVIKSPTLEIPPKAHEVKVSENDLHWEELRKGCLNREYHLCDLDFSDLKYESDEEVPLISRLGGAPPPPPAMPPPGMSLPGMPPPPPVPGPPPPHYRSIPPAPPPQTSLSDHSNNTESSTIKKNKKTVKLFWREIQEFPTSENLKSKVGGFIWDDLPEINLDTKMLEHLFESRTNDLIIKEKIAEPKRNLILDAKRSNAINIAMKKLPTPQSIKAAIMKMDATVIGREGIEKLLTMLPTEAEKVKIQEAQYANPDLPLGSAEQFLLTLASISELESRLKLWVFKLDYDNLEKEIAEPLMDLKQGIELLKMNKTFKAILSTLRTVGSFLNGSQVKGFRLEYLSKVMEVKDTVHKHPLLYHICEMIIMKFPESTDFFSEVGPVIRASKVDFEILSFNLQKLELDCKASWDHMKRVAKHDGPQIFKTKINEFLTDAAERIILLSVIKKRVMNRYSNFLLFLGVPLGDVEKTKPSEFLKVIAEFALEFRTSRERVLLQLEKRANHRERNKTRGKMIIDVSSYTAKSGDSSADSALKELLKPEPGEDSVSANRRRLSHHTPMPQLNGGLSPEDEMIESLVRTATSKPRTAKKRTKIGPSKKTSFNRRALSPPGQQWPTREYTTTGISAMQQR